ncbi:uncharacterized protein LOC116288083 isoform X2 [Actinia tenebrosa]|uniref:Uncharacterized protein LOC116288083 isoform X2 n=1 Tax=Actinia tenebrosa TaxID=6105 RepID=A0A6P8H5C5_ACTTE|nr:uncharacterized protein LOC116288083 isoform X2 [Actinia tenebrosa]
MILFRKKVFHVGITFAVTLITNLIIFASSRMNETNITTTATPDNSSTTTSPSKLPQPPLARSCIDKKVLNVCWLKTPPYIFDRPSNKSIVEGILSDAILEGFTKCECQVNLNYSIQVYEEEDLINCSKNKDIDIVLPFPQRGIRNNNWFFKVVDSAAIYLLLNRKKIESQAKANIIYEFSQVWTLAVLTILLAAIFGIVVWSLDAAWNRKQFPPTFCPGALEGVWWSFVTLTTVGYGDKTPKFPLARIFAILWMFVGMCMVSLLTATLTKTLTTGLVENRREFHGLKIGVLKSSHTYDEAVKKGAKTQKYLDLKSMYTALNNDEIQGILVDIFVATYVRNNLNVFGFQDNIFVAQSYDIQYSIGVYFGYGMAMYEDSKPFSILTDCLRSMFENANRRIDVFSIVEKYIQSQEIVETQRALLCLDTRK